MKNKNKKPPACRYMNVFGILSLAANSCFFLFWLSLYDINPLSPSCDIQEGTLAYSSISVQLTLFSLFFVVAGIAIAWISYFGFQTLKREILRASMEAAEEEVHDYAEKYLQGMIKNEIEKISIEAPFVTAEEAALSTKVKTHKREKDNP